MINGSNKDVTTESRYDTVDKLKKHPTVTAVANAIAAGLTNFIIQPVAILRTRLQSLNVYDHGIKDTRCNRILSLLRLCKRDGILSLYKGAPCSVFISGLGWLCFRFFYDNFAQLDYFLGQNDVKYNILRASMSSLLTSIILHPFWNAKLAIELQSGQTKIDGWPQYRGTIHYLLHTYKTGGLRNNFTGIFVSLSSISHHTVLITIYDGLSKLDWGAYSTLAPYQSFQPFVSGVLARLVPTTITYPLYVSRTMQQCFKTQVSDFSITKIMYWNARNNNLKGLYAGFPVQLMRSMLSGGIMFSTYEGLLHKIARIVEIYNFNKI